MASSSNFTPPSLLHHFKHNKVLHEQVIFLTIQPEDIPAFPESDRLTCETLGHGFHRIIARYGFMETPDVPRIVNRAFQEGMTPHVRPISYNLGRETLLLTGKSRMSLWRLHIFAFLSRNSKSAVEYFGIPPGRVVELGGQIEL
jgi:KUP system potassium uptake protein